MDFIISAQQLNRGLARVSTGIADKAMAEAMTGIWIEARDDHNIVVRGCDISSDVISWRTGNVQTPGTVVVHAGFKDWVFALSTEDQVHVALKKGRIYASCGKRNADFPTYNPAGYPDEKSRPEEGDYETVDALSILQAMDQVQFAMSKSSEKPSLQGIKITQNIAVATDGQRGAFSDRAPFERFDFLISSEAIGTLRDILQQSEEVEVGVVGSWAWVRNGRLGHGAGAEAWVATRNAKFPQRAVTTITGLYEASLPVNVVVNKDSLVASLTYARTLAQHARSLNENEYAQIGIDDAGCLFVRMQVKSSSSMYDIIEDVVITNENGEFIANPFEGWVTPGIFLQAINKSPGDTVTLSYIPAGYTKFNKRDVWYIKCQDYPGWGVMQAPMVEIPASEKVKQAVAKLRNNDDE